MPGAFPPSHWEEIKLSQALAGSGHVHTAACVAAAASSTPSAAGYCILLHPPPAPGTYPPAPRAQVCARSHCTLYKLPRAHSEAHEGGGTCSPWTCTHHDHGSLPGHLGVQGYGFVKYGPYKSRRVRAIILNIFSNIVQLFFPYIMGKLHWRVAALSRERVAGRH